MTTATVFFHVASLLLVRTASSSFLEQFSVNVGEDLVLKCFYKGSKYPYMFFWYKQTIGQKPNLMVTFNKQFKLPLFNNEFKNKRFGFDSSNDQKNLKISNVQISDSATYFCMVNFLDGFEFLSGITVSVRDSSLNVNLSFLDSPSGTLQPGDSGTLTCSIQSGTCDTGHSVYWFKDSKESQLEIIYTHEGREDQCERKPGTQTHTCFYHLSKENLSSHTETYRCAVASCGQILFGNSKALDSRGGVNSSVSIHVLCGGLTFTTVLVFFLAFTVYRLYKANSCQHTDSQDRSPSTPSPGAGDRQEAENLQYAALTVVKARGSRRLTEETSDQCLYSSVRHETDMVPVISHEDADVLECSDTLEHVSQNIQ